MKMFYSARAKLFSVTKDNLPDDAIEVPPEMFPLLGIDGSAEQEETVPDLAPAVDVVPEPPPPPPPEAFFYSSATRGFYSSYVHGELIPEDAVAISAEAHAALVEGQATGREIVPDTNGVPHLADPAPPTPQQLLGQYRLAVQGHIDQVAGQRGYDSGTSCASYAESTVPGWAAEASAMILWRDAVWQQVLSTFADVQSGKAEIPALEDLIADLPTIDWPA